MWHGVAKHPTAFQEGKIFDPAYWPRHLGLNSHKKFDPILNDVACYATLCYILHNTRPTDGYAGCYIRVKGNRFFDCT